MSEKFYHDRECSGRSCTQVPAPAAVGNPEKALAAIYKLLITPTGKEAALRHFQRDFDAVRKIAEPYYRQSMETHYDRSLDQYRRV